MFGDSSHSHTQYKVYADIHAGSHDLCKFSLDFMPASLYYVFRKRHAVVVFEFQVFVYDS